MASKANRRLCRTYSNLTSPYGDGVHRTTSRRSKNDMKWTQVDQTRQNDDKLKMCSVCHVAFQDSCHQHEHSMSTNHGRGRTKVRFLKLGLLSSDRTGIQPTFSADTIPFCSLLDTPPKDTLDTPPDSWFGNWPVNDQKLVPEGSALNIQDSQAIPGEIKQELDFISVEMDQDLSTLLKPKHSSEPEIYEEQTEESDGQQLSLTTNSHIPEYDPDETDSASISDARFQILLLSEEEEEEEEAEKFSIGHNGSSPFHVKCELAEETVVSSKQMCKDNQMEVLSETNSNQTSSCPTETAEVTQRTDEKLTEDDLPVEKDSMNLSSPSGMNTWFDDGVISTDSSPVHLQSPPPSSSLRLPLDVLSIEQVLSELKARAALFLCICGAGFLEKQLYDDHLIAHSPNKPFLCSYCHQQFSNGLNFNKHLLLHLCY